MWFYTKLRSSIFFLKIPFYCMWKDAFKFSPNFPPLINHTFKKKRLTIQRPHLNWEVNLMPNQKSTKVTTKLFTFRLCTCISLVIRFKCWILHSFYIWDADFERWWQLRKTRTRKETFLIWRISSIISVAL